MRALVTGANGFIGGHLVEHLLSKGYQVAALDLHTDWLRSLEPSAKLKVIHGDFSDRDLVDPELPGNEVCFHLASAHLETNVGDDYFWKVNVEHTLEFVERCHKAGIPRFIHCSTVGVYGDIKDPPADEASECHPDVAYEKSKLAGEKAVVAYCKTNNYQTIVIRPAWVYGPRCPRTEKLFRAISKGRFFFVGNGQTLRHPVYITDMLDGFLLAAGVESDPGEIFIIAGSSAVTLEELATTIANSLGVKPPALKLPEGFVKAGVVLIEDGSKLIGITPPYTRRSMKFYTGNTSFSIRKAEQILGFRPSVSLEDGVSFTRDWLLENGRIVSRQLMDGKSRYQR